MPITPNFKAALSWDVPSTAGKLRCSWYSLMAVAVNPSSRSCAAASPGGRIKSPSQINPKSLAVGSGITPVCLAISCSTGVKP